MKTPYHHHCIVRQEHLNHYGSIFGGRLLAIIDELAFIACSRTYPGKNFVTRAIDNTSFTAPAWLGDLLDFRFGIESVGKTSVHVRVENVVRSAKTGKPSKSFDGCVIMVCVDDSGRATPVEE